MDYIETLVYDIEEINNKIKKLEEKLNSKKSKNFDYVMWTFLCAGIAILFGGLLKLFNGEELVGVFAIIGSFSTAFSGMFLSFHLENNNKEKIELLNDKIENNKKLLLNKVIKLERTKNKIKNNTNYTNEEIKNVNNSNSFSNKKYKLKVKKREK